MNTMKHSLSSHKICTPMTMSISNRLCMHDLYLVKLQTYLLLIFVITNIISSDNHHFFKLNFSYFYNLPGLYEYNKTIIFKYIENYTVLICSFIKWYSIRNVVYISNDRLLFKDTVLENIEICW